MAILRRVFLWANQHIVTGANMSITKEIYESVVARDPSQPEFHQAVWEVLESLEPVL